MSKQRACISVIFLICCAAFTNSAICEVEDVDLDITFFPHVNPIVILDDYQGIVETLSTTNVTLVYMKDVKYLDVAYKDNKLLISTTPEYKNYDVNENEDHFRVNIFVQCNNGVETQIYEFLYDQRVKDTNNYAPVFNKESYTYEFYGEFDDEFELTSMMPISATDLDLSTGYISFDIEDTPDFHFYTSRSGKTTFLELYTMGYISPPYKKTFTLTATDDFKGEKKSTKTTLIIILRPPVDTLCFAKPHYEAKIINNTLEVLENIILVDGVDDCTQLKVISDYSEFFKASVDQLRNGIRLELVKPIPLPKSYTSFDLTIEATWKGVVATSTVRVTSDNPMPLICKLGDVDLTKKTYRNPEDIYDNHRGAVQVFNQTLNVASVKCFGSKYMTCTLANGILTVEATEDFKNYERDELDSIMAMNITVQCPYEEVTLEYRQFIMDINNHDPLFERKEYTYVFYNQIPKSFSLTDIIPIEVEDIDISNFRFYSSIEPEDNFYFDSFGWMNAKRANCSLSTKLEINPGFKKNYVLRITDSGVPKRNSTAKLAIEVKNEQVLEFTKPIYSSLILNGCFCDMNDKIEVVGGFDEELRLNLRSEYLDYFDVRPDMARKVIFVSLLKHPGDIKEQVTRVKIEAEWKGLKAETILYVYLDGKLLSPEAENPGEFSGYDNWVSEYKLADNNCKCL